MSSSKPKVLILSGSYRPSSLTRHALKYVEALVTKAGMEPEVLCARDLDLPIFDPPNDAAVVNAARFRNAVKQAAGVIVGSPEYHGSFSGVLKNMIDYLGYAETEGKPVALVVGSGGPKTGVGTLNALRVVFRSLRAPVIVEQLSVCPSDFEADTRKMNAETIGQLSAVIDGLRREIRLRARVAEVEERASA